MPASHATRPAAFARILATIVVCACAFTAVASAATPAPSTVFKGRTSQDLPIALTIAAGHVTKLKFRITIACASHHSYQGPVWGFAAIAIGHGRFSVTLTSKKPAATTTVSGRVGAHRVHGSVRLRRYVASEHGFCKGTATFDLRHRP